MTRFVAANRIYLNNKKNITMFSSLKKSKLIAGVLISAALSFSFPANATVVEVRTNVGNFQINLFDQETPETVENFLSYVNSGSYANAVFHRSVPGFVLQGGGFAYNNTFPPNAIAAGSPVVNEPVLSNVRGTIAMAKVGGNPNSATNQWFVNAANNAGNLDNQNGGFTVFGQVLGDGMDVVDEILALNRFNYGGAFDTIPLKDFTAEQASSGAEPTGDNLIVISDIVVIDATVVTNPNLNPVRNTSVDAGGDDGDSDSGGALGWLLVSVLSLFAIRKRVIIR